MATGELLREARQLPSPVLGSCSGSGQARGDAPSRPAPYGDMRGRGRGPEPPGAIERMGHSTTRATTVHLHGGAGRHHDGVPDRRQDAGWPGIQGVRPDRDSNAGPTA